MARVFGGITYLTSAEMADKCGGSQAMWAHYAREGKVPATKFVDGCWYFDPNQVEVNGFNANQYEGK